jgi:HEAT repeat protein
MFNSPELRFQALVNSLNAIDSEERCSAAQELAKIGNPQAISPLIYSLSDENEAVQASIIEALVAFGEKAAIQLINLLKMTDRLDEEVLGVKNPQIAQVLNVLKLGNLKSALNSINMIGEGLDSADQDDFFQVFSNISTVFRGMATAQTLAQTLEAVGQPVAVDLIPALHDKSPLVRETVAKIMAKSGDKRTIVPLIIAAQAEQDFYVHQAMTEALAILGD